MDANLVRIRPPHGEASGDRNASQAVAITAASTAAQPLVPAGQTQPLGGGMWIAWKCTSAFRIRVGTSTVGAATANDYFVAAGEEFQRWCLSREDTHFRAIRDTADGTLTWYTAE